MRPISGVQNCEYQWGGITAEGTSFKEAIRPVFPTEKRVVIGVRGKWYDVTTFVPHHPGGDVLLDFVGRDATAQFLAYHDEDVVLGNRKPIGTYEWNEDAPGGDAMEGDYFKLGAKFKQLGYYESDTLWTLQKFGLTLCFFAFSLLCVYSIRQTHSWPVLVAGAVSLAGFWQQSGFLMHDFMHNQVFHRRNVDQAFGWFFGGVCFGVSGRWWRDEHNEHHLFTNTFVRGVGKSDPQMGETVWCQDVKLSPFFNRFILRMLLKIQHLIFLPVLILIGPISIKIDSLLCEDRPWEFFGLGLHVAWVSALVSAFPNVYHGLAFWYIASCCVGVLEIQLLISHYSKPFEQKDLAKDMGGFARRQVSSVIDIQCPPWLDWFHGGLNLHSPHHLFPRISRKYYRKVYPEIQSLCKRHGQKLDSMGWVECIGATLSHLKKMDTLFSMDPR